MRNESQESQYLRKFKFCLASKSNWDVATELCSDQFRQIYNTDKLVWIYYFHSKSTSTSSCISNISNIYILNISVSSHTYVYRVVSVSKARIRCFQFFRTPETELYAIQGVAKRLLNFESLSVTHFWLRKQPNKS